MKITVNARTVFAFPTILLVNRMAVGIIRRRLKKEGIVLNRKQTLLFIRKIKQYKKNHSEWNLIEVEAKNGDLIKVRI